MTKLAQTIAKKTEKAYTGLGYAIENGSTITSDLEHLVLIEPMIEIDGATRADEMPLPRWHTDADYGEDMHLPKHFTDDLRWVAKASGRKDVRWYLNGVSFQTGRIIATNGHRLHQAKDQHYPELGIVPIEGIKGLLSLAREKGKATPISVARADQAVRFTVGDCQLHVRLIEGTYPEIDRVVPREVYPLGVDLTAIGYKYRKQFKAKFGPALRVYRGTICTPDSETVAEYDGSVLDSVNGYSGTAFNMDFLADAKTKGGETFLRIDREIALVKSDTRMAVIMGMRT